MSKKTPARSRQKTGRSLVEAVPHRTVGGTHAIDDHDVPVEHESPYERIAHTTLPLCEDVLAFRANDETYEYLDDNNRQRSYTPDLSISLESKKLWVEIKPIRWLMREDNLSKYIRIARSFLHQGRTLHFLVEDQLLIEPRASIVNILRRYLHQSPQLKSLPASKSALQDGPMAIERLIDQYGIPHVDVLILVAQRKLAIDWSAPLNRTSLVSLPNSPFRNLRYEDIRGAGRFSPLLAELALGRRPTDRQLLAAASLGRRRHRVDNPWSMAGVESEWQFDSTGLEAMPSSNTDEPRRAASLVAGAPSFDTWCAERSRA